MQYPIPPTSTPFATLRPDFPEEIGALENLQKSILKKEASMTRAVKELFPPMTKAEDIPNLVKYLAVPDQVAYFERLSADQKSVVVCVQFTATVGSNLIPKPMWGDFVEMCRAKLGHGPGLLPFQMEVPNVDKAVTPFPPRILVHNRRTGELHLESTANLSSFLQKRMAWSAPMN